MGMCVLGTGGVVRDVYSMCAAETNDTVRGTGHIGVLGRVGLGQ